MELFEKYRKLNIDGSQINLEYLEDVEPYFCYPKHAKVIGYEQNILYCFIEEYGEMVFASNPESCADVFVYPLARNFEDFLRLIITCGSVNPIEQIIWMNEEQFLHHLEEERKLRTSQQTKILKMLKKEFQLSEMEHSYDYVKMIQNEFDGSQIQYRQEYYEILGLEAPDCDIENKKAHCFEFEPVVFKIEK